MRKQYKRLPAQHTNLPVEVMMKKRFLYLFAFSLLSVSCNMPSPSDNADKEFYPLSIGRQWTYTVVESDQDLSDIRFPSRFTISVIGDTVIQDKKYYSVTNYFVPGPTLLDTVYLRSSNAQVYLRLTPLSDEQLFYTFTSMDTSWEVSMYVNPTTLYSYSAHLANLSEIQATIHWNWDGRSEARWQEHFTRDIGRTEIRSFSQVFGKVVWKLE